VDKLNCSSFKNELEHLKDQNLFLSGLLDNINFIVYRRLMVNDDIQVDLARKELLNELEKWASMGTLK